ncbi:hypothetical protein V5799_008122 [Amblyomma americanum]|uniref:Peptidase M13 C-terminal domain-containing protein n=1 Tax=Amblyomma americanum TaxID=6943 RepID=A0AAQ4FFD6_AMBAM
MRHGERLVVPCVPTHSGAKVQLWKDLGQGEVEEVSLAPSFVEFDPMRGCIIYYPPSYYAGHFVCNGSAPGRVYKDSSMAMVLAYLPSVDIVPKVKFEKGINFDPVPNGSFTLSCIVTVEAVAIFNMSWDYPNKNVPLFSLLREEFLEANITLYENETVELYALKYYDELNRFLESADSYLSYVKIVPSRKYCFGYRITNGRGKCSSCDSRTTKPLYPAGILQGVFYQHGLPRSLNFGAIGMVVGHEMTHGFDDSGSQFDAEGALQEWWTNSTRTHFEKKAKCFEYQYGNITDQATNMTVRVRNVCCPYTFMTYTLHVHSVETASV